MSLKLSLKQVNVYSVHAYSRVIAPAILILNIEKNKEGQRDSQGDSAVLEIIFWAQYTYAYVFPCVLVKAVFLSYQLLQEKQDPTWVKS